MSNDSIETLWKTLTAGTGGALAFAFRSLLGLSTRTEVIETRLEAHERQLQRGAEKIEATHTAVIRLETTMGGMQREIGQVKDGQEKILDRINEILGKR